MADKQLTLGTLFSADAKPLFDALDKVKTQLNMIATAAKQLESSLGSMNAVVKNASTGLGTYALKTDLVSKSIKGATGESSKFKEALSHLNSIASQTKTGFDTAHATLMKVEKAIHSTGQAMTKAGQNGKLYADSTDRISKVTDVLTGKMGISSGQFVKLTSDGKNLSTVQANLSSKYNDFKTAVDVVNQKLASGVISSKNASAAMQGLATRYNEAGKATASLVKHKESLITKYPQLRSQVETLSKQVSAGNLTWAEGERVLKKVNQAHHEAASAAGKSGSAVKTATSSYDTLGKSMTNVHGAVERLSHAMKVTASYGLASAAIFGVVTALKAGVQAIIDYDQSLKNLQAITGATDAEVTTMGETIKSVARDTKFSASEVADGMTLLGQAGLSAGESITVMRDTATLATGTMSDMQLVTDLMSTSLRAFNLDASESGRIADVMANAMNKSKLDIDKLRTAFNYVAASAHQAGLSLEETAASMMVLADHGVRASTIGTGLRQVLARVVNPSEKLAGALAQVGLTLKDVNPSMSGWEGTLKSLSRVLYDSETKTVNMAKAFDLFGLRGAQAAAILVSSYVSGGFSAAIKATYEIGSAADMAAKQQEGLGIIIKNLVDRAKNMAIAFGDAGVTGVMKTFLKVVSAGVVALESFASSTMGQTILMVTAFTTAISLTTKAWGALITAMSASSVLRIRELALVFAGMSTTLTGKTGLVGSLSLVGSAIANLITKINPFVLAATAAGVAVLAYRNHLDNTVKSAEILAVTNMGTVSSLTAFQGALKSTGDKFLKLKDDTGLAKGANDAYIATLQRLIEQHPKLKGKIELTTDALDKNNKILAEFTQEAHLSRLQSLVDLYNEYGEAAKRAQFWAGVWEGIKVAIDGVAWVFRAFVDGFVTGWDLIGKGLGALFIHIGELAAKIPVVGTTLSAVFTTIGETLKTGVQNVNDFYMNLGAKSEEATVKQKKQQDAVEAMAMAYATEAQHATKTQEQIRAELDKTAGATQKFKDDVIARWQELHDRAVTNINAIKDAQAVAVNEMTTGWKSYMESKDLQGQYEVQQAWERLQKQAKDYSEFLAQKVKANEITSQQMVDELVKWWAVELVKHQEKEDSKLNKTQNRIDKELNAEQTLANKIMEMQRKLQADINAIEEAGMSQRELSKKHELEAYTAVEEAKKAIAIASAEGATKAQIQAAFDAVEAARNALAKISEDSKKTSEDVKGHAKDSATSVSSSMKGMADQNEDTWNTVSTTISSSISDTTNKHKESADKIKEELGGITDKTKAENEEWRDESGRTKEQIIADWKAAAENAGREIKSVITEADRLTIVWKKVNEDGSVSLGSWTTALTTLKDESIPSVKVALEGLITELGKIKTEAEEPKEYKLDATKAKTDLGDVATKATDIKTKVETPKTLSVDTATANTGLTGIQTLLTTITTTVWNAALTIVTTGAEAVTAAKDTLVEIAKAWASSLTITVTGLADLVSALAYHRALDGLRTDSYHTVHVNYEGEGSTVKPLGEKVKEVKGWLESIKALAEKGAKFTIEFMGKGSTAKPLGEKIAEIKGWEKDNAKEYEKGGAVQQLDRGGGFVQKGISFWGSIPGKFGQSLRSESDIVQDFVDRYKHLDSLDARKTFMSGLSSLLTGDIKVYAEFERYLKDVQEERQKRFDYLSGKRRNIAFSPPPTEESINRNYPMDNITEGVVKVLIAEMVSKKYWDIQSGIRRKTGGPIPGYGGGDTVPAMLERGEYVMRKEAAQKYGTGLMNSINSGMAKFMAGGIVKPQIVFDQPMQRFASGGQVASATSMNAAASSGVPINIILSPMFMTGDKNSMRQAAETLRTELKNIDHRYGVA